jgi:hypothetical protein
VHLSDCTIEGNAFEGVAAAGSSVSLFNCTVAKNRTYGIWAQHGSAALSNVDVAGSMTGVAADGLALITTSGQYLRIHDNQVGVRLKLNSVASHAGAVPDVSQNATDFEIDQGSIW